MRRLLTLFLSLSAFTANAASNRGLVKDFERVLFPIWTDDPGLPGANGSRWIGHGLVLNDGDHPVSFYPTTSQYGRYVGKLPERWTLDVSFISNTVFGGGNGDQDDIPGRIFYLSRDGGDSVIFADRFYDANDTSSTLGTEVPVVRERDFRTATIVLPGIPVGDQFRVMLRVYDPDQVPGAEVIIRLRAESTTRDVGAFPTGPRDAPVVATRTLGFRIAPVCLSNPDTLCSEPNVEPGYAQLSIDHDLVGDLRQGTVYAEIEPLTPALRFWAFVSLTNNVTQQVTTVTPH